MARVNAEEGYEEYAKHHTQVFDSLRRSIKKTIPMFAFGEPTPEIVMLLFKIYNENIIRSLSSALDQKTATSFEKLKCMFGVYHAQDGTLYVTISESPGIVEGDKATDEFYMAKRTAVFNLLKSAGIRVHYQEEDAPEIFKKEPVVSIGSRWRKGVDVKDTTDWNTIPESDMIKSEIKAKKLDNMMFLDRDFDKSDNNIHIYDRRIREYPMEVYFVDSWKYLQNRTHKFNNSGENTRLYEGPTFKPFKKYSRTMVEIDNANSPSGKRKVSKWTAECNNGHLCTESKLFAYAQTKGIKPQSVVAYWIGNDTPPNHIIRSYCYRTEGSEAELEKLLLGVKEDNVSTREEITKGYSNEIEKERADLNSLGADCLQYLVKIKGLEFIAREYAAVRLGDKESKLDRVIERAVQPCAVVCPGCFANLQDYKNGKKVFWNSRNCYFSRNSVLRGGKSRKTKTRRRNRKQNKKTRKTH